MSAGSRASLVFTWKDRSSHLRSQAYIPCSTSGSRPSEDEQALIRPNSGVKVLTLAPERVPKGFISRLTSAGFRICLGHSVATYEETKAAMSEGLVGFTHLFNAMRPLGSREPGPIAAAHRITECMVWNDRRWSACRCRHASSCLCAARPLPCWLLTPCPPLGEHALLFGCMGIRSTVSTDVASEAMALGRVQARYGERGPELRSASRCAA